MEAMPHDGKRVDGDSSLVSKGFKMKLETTDDMGQQIEELEPTRFPEDRKKTTTTRWWRYETRVETTETTAQDENLTRI